MKKFLAEFKTFISRGNVIDMAVGVVVGGAFTSIVNALVGDILMPLVSLLTDGINFEDLNLHLYGDVYLAYGHFIQQVVVFLIVAFAVFSLVKLLNSMKKPQEEVKVEPVVSEDVLLLREIRDSLRK